MDDTEQRTPPSETQVITVHYWASARSAAGVDGDVVPTSGPLTLAVLLSRLVALHPGGRLLPVLEACSVLLDGRQAGVDDPADVLVPPGSTLEFLPPFAGG